MSFDAAWLDLREAADHAARDRRLLAQAKSYLAKTESPLIVDLGAGTGSTVRTFDMPYATWRLVDHDGRLLEEAQRRCGASASTIILDLRDVTTIPIDGARLVTASALADLVSADWIDALADRLAAAGIGFYAALSYDGRMDWTPADGDDQAVAAAFNRHQTGDKGFGPALGPAGGEYLADVMRRRGFVVEIAPSPWVLGAEQLALQRELLPGIADAAEKVGCSGARAWLQKRLGSLQTAQCRIGHIDVLALPGG